MKSNCFLESVKQFITNPTKIRIYKRGSWLEVFRLKFPHFYWLDKRDGCYYHFCANNLNKPFLQQLWFAGKVRRFLWHNK
jgi:hypothetical protein